MNNKQSSIDFMHDAFMEVLGRKRPMTSNEVAKIWLQAREMHRQEMDKVAGDFWNEGASYMHDGQRKYNSFDDYYNQTFGGHETN